MNRLSDIKIYLLIVIVSSLLFIPFLGGVHLFDWDEINFAEAAREMIVTQNYTRVMIDYEPFWEKPPLFIWMQVASMKFFGINEFAARFPNAIVGILSLLLLYALGKKMYDRQFGLLWVLIYVGSILPSFYFRTGIIDPTFNLFIFLGIYFISEHYRLILSTNGNSGYKKIVLAGIAVGLAILTKGPVGYLLPMLSLFIFWIYYRKVIRFPWKEGVLFSLTAFVVAGIWFGLEYFKNGSWFIEKFVEYQFRLLATGEAGHGQPFYYHFIVLFFGCFPATMFIFSAFRRYNDNAIPQLLFREWMIILFCVVLFVFSIVKTKIVHYSSLAYYPLTFLATYYIYGVITKNLQWKKYIGWLVGCVGILISILFAGFPIAIIYKDNWVHLVKDKFARENILADVQWFYFDSIAGILILIGLIIELLLLRKREIKNAVFTLFGIMVIAFSLAIIFLTPKIEAHTQGAVIEFYKSLVGKECYVKVLGFKSYAHLFYIDKRPEQSPSYKNIPYDDFETWLLEGKIDKPAYFVCKIQDEKNFLKFTKKKELYRKNGFIFYKRDVE